MSKVEIILILCVIKGSMSHSCLPSCAVHKAVTVRVMHAKQGGGKGWWCESLAEWAPELVWMLWGSDKSLAAVGNSNH